MNLRLPLALLLAFGAAYSHAQSPVPNPTAVCSQRYLKSLATVAGVEFRTYEAGAGDLTCITVVQAGRVVFRRSNDNHGDFTLGQQENKEYEVPALPNGTDVTGRGQPDMVVSAWSGGAHCCRTDYVFELKPRVRLLASIHSQDDDLAHFEKRGNRYYFVTGDWTFAYWFGSFAGSPTHDVVLAFERDGKFHVAWDQMQKPAPSNADWEKALSEVRGEAAQEDGFDSGALRIALWNEVLDLIYTGHADLAWKFVAEAGPDAQKGHMPKLEDFCSALKTSEYWEDVKALMGTPPRICLKAKPER